jgi:hypothetical protein
MSEITVITSCIKYKNPQGKWIADMLYLGCKDRYIESISFDGKNFLDFSVYRTAVRKNSIKPSVILFKIWGIMRTIVKHHKNHTMKKFRTGENPIILSLLYEKSRIVMLSIFNEQVKKFLSPDTECHGLDCQNKNFACSLTVEVENNMCIPTSPLLSSNTRQISFCSFHMLGFFVHSNSMSMIGYSSFYSHCGCPVRKNIIETEGSRKEEIVMCTVCYTTGIQRQHLFNNCYQTDFSLKELVEVAQCLYKKNGVTTLQEAMDKLMSERP